jgi:hypothetical protein
MGAVKQLSINGNIKTNGELRTAVERGAATSKTVRRADNLDTCEMCEATAVCSTITIEVGGEFADMLVCDHCRLSVAFSRMGNLERDRVTQLRGTNNE